MRIALSFSVLFFSLMAQANPKDAICTVDLADLPKAAVAVESVRPKVVGLLNYLNANVLGQETLNERAVIAAVLNKHILIEGPHGSGKTTLVKLMADAVSADFKRVQFTQDLMPSQITGRSVFNSESRGHDFYPGPVFTNILLADEINRAPETTQAALLESMEEKQVTVDGVTRPLPDFSVVFATQNPKTQAGTYKLPEAQLDRFMFKLDVTYPSQDIERQIIDLKMSGTKKQTDGFKIETSALGQALIEAHGVSVPRTVKNYVADLIDIARFPNTYPELRGFLDEGISNRGTMDLIRSAQALAWLRDKSIVTKDEVNDLLVNVLNHRIILSDKAKSEGISANEIIDKIKSIASVRN